MDQKHIETLRELDAKAARHFCDLPGRNVVAKLGARHRDKRYEVTITRTRSGFYAATNVNGTVYSQLSKYASGAFLMLCGSLKQIAG